MDSKRKYRNELSIHCKKEVLDLIDKGVSQRKIALQFGVAKTTIANINKNKDAILKSWNDNSESKRRFRKSEYESVNSLVLKYYEECRALNISVTGPMLKSKAKEIAQELQMCNFQASNGWLESFRIRNNINFRLLSCEAAAADLAAFEELKSKLRIISKEYPLKNQFCARETGIFYQQIPKSMAQKGDKRNDVRLSNEKLSVLFCCSASGEKLKPLVIGNASSHIFKEKHMDMLLSVTWWSNEETSLTGDIFEEWLETVNQQMQKQNRKILLLIDNDTNYKGVTELSNIEVKFFPFSQKSEIRPLELGIIRAVKIRYRRKMLQYLLTSAENCKTKSEFNTSVSIFDAVRWISGAWEEITRETIQKCFNRAGFQQQTDEMEVDEENTSYSHPWAVKSELASVDNVGSYDGRGSATTQDFLEVILQTFDESPVSQTKNENDPCDDDGTDRAHEGKIKTVISENNSTDYEDTETVHEEKNPIIKSENDPCESDDTEQEKIQTFKSENGNSDFDDTETVHDEQIQTIKSENDICGCDNTETLHEVNASPSPNHEDALHHVLQLIKYSSAHQPDLMQDLYRLYNSIETQWAAKKWGTCKPY